MSKDKTGQGPIFVKLSNEIQNSTTYKTVLEGRMLTLIDAMIADKDQREAFKSLVRETIRQVYSESRDSIEQLINLFTDTFEGKEIEYTKFGPSPINAEHDVRKHHDPVGNGDPGQTPVAWNPFKK